MIIRGHGEHARCIDQDQEGEIQFGNERAEGNVANDADAFGFE
jgi:hypothetical protein